LILEHGLYTAALAIIVAMFYEKYTKNSPVLIASVIWFAMFIPDTDYIVGVIVDATTKIPIIQHGDFHNLLFLGLSTIIIGWLVAKKYQTKITVTAAMSCIFIGFLSHLVEDALVYKSAYAFLAPFSETIWHTGWMPYTRNMMYFGINWGSKECYTIGFMLLTGAVLTRYMLQGSDWLVPYSDKFRFKQLCAALGIFTNDQEVSD
jgi:hypothetical protein